MSFSKPALASEEIKEFVLQQGVDIVGIASVDAMRKLPLKRDPELVLPGAKSVVTYGIPMLTGAWDSPSERTKTFHGHVMYEELSRIAYQTGRFIERRGFRASAPPVHLPVDMSAEAKGLAADLSFKHAAVAAGLGVMSHMCTVVTPQWGPRIRFGAVVTDAVLEPDAMMGADLCGTCNLCIEACPVGAISPGFNLNSSRCNRRLVRTGLGASIKFWSEIFKKSQEEREKALMNPEFWELWQTQGLLFRYDCTECLKACPLGVSPRGLRRVRKGRPL